MKNLFIHIFLLVICFTIPCNISASSYDGSYLINIPKQIDASTTDSFTISVIENNIYSYQKLNISLNNTICMKDDYGKDDVYGKVNDTSFTLNPGETKDLDVSYTIDKLSAGNWQGKIDINIEIENNFPSYTTIAGPELNEILASYRPSSIIFTNDLIPLENYTDISLAKDDSVKLYYDEATAAVTISTNVKHKIVANDDFSKAFKGLTLLTSIDGLEYLDTSNCTNMSEMFSGLIKLTNLDLKDLNTSNNKNFSHFFYGCSKLNNIANLETIDTSNAYDLSYMFYNNAKNVTDLNIISNWNVSKVKDFSYFLYQYDYADRKSTYNILDLDLSKWDISNANNMAHMFDSLWLLKSIDTSSFKNTNGLLDISYMFNNCKYLTRVNLSSLDTSSLTNMSSLFKDCNSLLETGNLNNWQTSSINDMSYAFYGTWSLDISNSGDLNNWQVNNPDKTEMFGHSSAYIGHEPNWY